MKKSILISLILICFIGCSKDDNDEEIRNKKLEAAVTERLLPDVYSVSFHEFKEEHTTFENSYAYEFFKNRELLDFVESNYTTPYYYVKFKWKSEEGAKEGKFIGFINNKFEMLLMENTNF